ncbi:MAG: c-type cytochrome [Ignavibacteria bacterium]
MKHLIIISITAILLFSCSKNEPLGWKYPDMSQVPKTPAGDMIKFGKELISHTNVHIGPYAENPARRFAGNNLVCSNCHIDAGTRPNTLGFVGTYLLYPAYSGRVDTIISIRQRINECMVRSMNGRPLPFESYEMNCLVAYYQWISIDVIPQVGEKYDALKKLKFMDRAADPNLGRAVYNRKCNTCHAENGAGAYLSGEMEKGFDIPSVWGIDSYNIGAGMYSLITAAEFVKQKMPYYNANLTDEESWDVAAYLVSKPHPFMAGLEKDFPDLNEKPIDCPYPPYADSLSVDRHKYGPFTGLKGKVGK